MPQTPLPALPPLKVMWSRCQRGPPSQVVPSFGAQEGRSLAQGPCQWTCLAIRLGDCGISEWEELVSYLDTDSPPL